MARMRSRLELPGGPAGGRPDLLASRRPVPDQSQSQTQTQSTIYGWRCATNVEGGSM